MEDQCWFIKVFDEYFNTSVLFLIPRYVSIFLGANVATSSYDAEVMWGSGVNNLIPAARTAIGIGTPSILSSDSKQLLIMVVDGEDDITGISLPDLAEEFIKLNTYKACNLDGGGSTELAINKVLVNLPDGGTYQRPLAASVMLL